MTGFAKFIAAAPWTARVGLVIICGYTVAFLFAPWLAPFGETELVGDAYMPWDDKHILGTDNVGRDMLSRLIYGARNTIGIALVTTALAFVVGVIAGFLAATVGGWLDQAFSRLVDILMAIPGIIFALLLLTIFGSTLWVVILVIATVEGTRVFRLARAVGQSIVVLDYVEAARIRGEGLGWIMLREVLPNAIPPLAAEFGLRFCFVFLFLAGQLSRSRHSAADRRLGQHGQGKRHFDQLWRHHPAVAGRRHRPAHRWGQFPGRLVPP